MSSYYNDNDPKSAEWVRQLIKFGMIPDGEVDERSILDVHADDLKGFTQCHFFCGIAGWPYALKLAEIPHDLPLWTGSPPCQPFSVAGKSKGKQDERHLAPKFIELVGTARPRLLFGEQVASAAVFGKAAKKAKHRPAVAPAWAWFDDLSDRLEAARYAVGAADIPAAGVGAYHIRQRTFFGAVRLADAQHNDGWPDLTQREPEIRAAYGGRGEPVRMADADGPRLEGAEWGGPNGTQGQRVGHGAERGGIGQLADAETIGRDFRTGLSNGGTHGGGVEPADTSGIGRLADAVSPRLEGYVGHGDAGGEPRRHDQGPNGSVAAQSDPDAVERHAARSHANDSFWGTADWLFCRDGKWRPVEPRTQRMVDGVSHAMAALWIIGIPAQRIAYATTCEKFGPEILQSLRDGNAPEEIWGEIGRRIGFSEATILFATLCQLPRKLGGFGDRETSGSPQDCRETLSTLWDYPKTNARTPPRRGLHEQRFEKFGNLVSELSQTSAPVRELVNMLTVFNDMPLSKSPKGRIGLLRGYGNAIVPQAAAEFVKAFVKCL